MPKLKILCLHGLAENAIYMRKKTEFMMRSVEDMVDLVYINGPYLVLPAEHNSTDVQYKHGDGIEDNSIASLSYSYWNPRRYDPMVLANKSVDPNQKTWDLLRKVLIEQGPFDGILGFSQGGALAAILSILLAGQDVIPNPLGPDTVHPPLRFTIIIGSMMPMTKSGFAGLFMQPTKAETPSMHIMGELDTIVGMKAMEHLASRFKNPVLIRHPGGPIHISPTT
ncbi:hypothetical protein [Absidia glauca]|uniref:Serine hydrolase domain-containing protein n=1 Tax=Absidia glauca TaxID=4829 RepID=A0A168QCK9_ABSGL|nr:hypothetical protein [Absidia glauca]